MPIAIYDYPVVVRSNDIDENHHANNVSYIRWMQEAATAHSEQNGWTSRRYTQHHTAWVARRHTIDYLAPAWEGEEIIVRTWVASWKKVSSTRRYKFLRKKDGAVLAKAETNWAFINPETGRPTKILPEVSESFLVVPLGDEQTQPPSVSAEI